jgi:hypothetical protein
MSAVEGQPGATTLLNKMKHFHRIATRCEETALSLVAMLFLVGAMIRLR